MSLQLEAEKSLGSLTLLDGSHSYVAAHTEHYKSKMVPGDMARAQTEALAAFVLQFTTVDYSKVCRRGGSFLDLLNHVPDRGNFLWV